MVSSWLLVEAGGEALEAAGFEVVSVTVEPSLSGLHLLRVDLLVGGGVGGFQHPDRLTGLCLVLSGCASRYQDPIASSVGRRRRLVGLGGVVAVGET